MTPGVSPLPDAGWRLAAPLDWVPSANRTTREHWSARNRRVGVLTADLIWLRQYAQVPCAHTITRRSRVGALVAERVESVVFERASLALTLYFGRRSRRDPGNFGQGAGAKSLVDGLVRSGWLADDDAEHLTCAEPVLHVDRGNPRVEIDLRPWDGVRR